MQLRYIILLLLIINCTSVKSQQLAHSVKAHFKQISLLFNIDEKGAPTYTVNYNNQPVILSSALGFGLADGKQLTQNFEIVGIDSTENNSTWQPVWGEVKEIKDHHKQICFRLKQKNPPFIQLNIVFKLFEEGVGFKYEFPNQPGLRFFTITNEHTEFNLAGNHTAFWIPGDYDSNEYTYRQTKLNEVDAWQFPLFNNSKIEKRIPFNNLVQTPLMLKTANGLYINIHEAALVNYSALYLQVNKNNFSLKASLVPDAEGNMAYLRTPANTPWRTIIVSNKAKDILASKMILNLNEPSKITETGWIKPMKFMGVWWEMQTGKSAWSYTNNVDTTDANGRLIPHGKHAANTENVLKYIDFAAQFGIEGLLIEGWNKGWEEWTDVWKEQNFDYVTPYPDFDLPRITAYAKQKNVQLIMHNETGGSATNYDRLLDTAYRFMTQNGYKAVKTGYVGKIIPNGEHHDGQWMVLHYERVAKKAADYKVMIDMHEPVRPTGLHRTYPNWLANEAARGNEWHAFANGNPPNHETILPFTRLIGGPMDYTPGIFKLRNYAKDAPERQMNSTLCKQLALYVTLYSPLQMVADIPENYLAYPDAFNFIQQVPVDWDDTQILEAEPGEFITIARKAKGGTNWYIGGITGNNKRIANCHFNFLIPGKKYRVTLFADAPNADWKFNPEAYTIQKKTVTKEAHLQVPIAAGGGFAMIVEELP